MVFHASYFNSSEAEIRLIKLRLLGKFTNMLQEQPHPTPNCRHEPP